MTFFGLLGKIDASYKRRILPLFGFGALGKMDTSYMRCILPLFGFKAQLRLLGLSARAVRRPFRLCVRCTQAGPEHILGGYIIDGLGSLNHS